MSRAFGAEPSARFGSGASPRMPWKTVRRCPSGMCRPACRIGVSTSPCLDADGPLASKSTRRKLPTVPERPRSFRTVSTSADTAASGIIERPHPPSNTSPSPGSESRRISPLESRRVGDLLATELMPSCRYRFRQGSRRDSSVTSFFGSRGTHRPAPLYWFAVGERAGRETSPRRTKRHGRSAPRSREEMA